MTIVKPQVCGTGCIIFYSSCAVPCHAKSLQSRPTLCDPMDLAQWAPLFVGFSRQNTGVGCHALLQGIFPTEGLNLRFLCLLHWQVSYSPLVVVIAKLKKKYIYICMYLRFLFTKVYNEIKKLLNV